MGVIKKSVRRKPTSGSKRVRYKSHSRSGGLVGSYSQKTRSGIRIRVRGHGRGTSRIKSSLRKKS